jgi:hypothetical protein
MSSSSADNTYNNTSYKPFAQSNYANNNEDEVCSIRRQLSAIDEEIIKRTTLLQLKERLFNLPHVAKSSLVYAQQVTDIVDDDHLLGFLYVENYNVDVSVSFRRGGTCKMCRQFLLQLQILYIFQCLLKPQHIACTNEVATILAYSTQGIW